MNEQVKKFFEFLKFELEYLRNVAEFIETIPSLIANKRINSHEFGNFLEKYELEVYKIASKKRGLLIKLSEYYNTDVGNINLSFLSKIEGIEIEKTGKEIFSISNKIKLALLKSSIYLTKFAKLNSDLKKVNNFLFQDNYASNGIENKNQKNSIFVSEA